LISAAFITHWRSVIPWAADHQVEHDLVISRVLVELFSDASLAGALAFRGGTAIHKLLLASPARFSDDIALVQIAAGPIGDIMKALRQRLDALLGESTFEHGRIGHTAVYRFESEIPPVQPLRLKIEINTREHFSVLGLHTRQFSVDSPWGSGTADVVTFQPAELLATKLRALYQRSKGRDLFDLALAIERGLADPEDVIRCCLEYLRAGKTPITQRQFARNLRAKIGRAEFRGDIVPLLAPGTIFDVDAAFDGVMQNFIDRWPIR
jgi:predicted nucleotidyltransferase component of viral defense system